MSGTSSQTAAEWLARTLIRGDPFITVGVQANGEVLVGFGTGSYVITIRDQINFLLTPTVPGEETP